MIPVSKKSIKDRLPVAWIKRAKELGEELAKLKDSESDKEKRAALIKANAKLWGEVKETLGSVTNNKCWYCESTQDRSNKDVDHFRPKSHVAESNSGEGYWWLAFDWENYRYSCNYCNSLHKPDSDQLEAQADDEEEDGRRKALGKADHFPIFDPAKRGSPFANSTTLDQGEDAMLLDPLQPTDVALITFEEEVGELVCLYPEDPIALERVRKSIKTYNLNSRKLMNRRRSLMDTARLLLSSAREDAPNYKQLVQELTEMAHMNADHSAAVRAVLGRLRPNNPVVQIVLGS